MLKKLVYVEVQVINDLMPIKVHIKKMLKILNIFLFTHIPASTWRKVEGLLIHADLTSVDLL